MKKLIPANNAISVDESGKVTCNLLQSQFNSNDGSSGLTQDVTVVTGITPLVTATLSYKNEILVGVA